MLRHPAIVKLSFLCTHAHTHLDAPPPCLLFSLRAGTPQTPDQQWNVSALAGSKAPAGSLTSPDRNPIKPLWGDQSETVCLCECAKRCNGGGDWTILHLDKWSEEDTHTHTLAHTQGPDAFHSQSPQGKCFMSVNLLNIRCSYLSNMPQSGYNKKFKPQGRYTHFIQSRCFTVSNWPKKLSIKLNKKSI